MLRLKTRFTMLFLLMQQITCMAMRPPLVVETVAAAHQAGQFTSEQISIIKNSLRAFVVHNQDIDISLDQEAATCLRPVLAYALLQYRATELMIASERIHEASRHLYAIWLTDLIIDLKKCGISFESLKGSELINLLDETVRCGGFANLLEYNNYSCSFCRRIPQHFAMTYRIKQCCASLVCEECFQQPARLQYPLEIFQSCNTASNRPDQVIIDNTYDQWITTLPQNPAEVIAMPQAIMRIQQRLARR